MATKIKQMEALQKSRKCAKITVNFDVIFKIIDVFVYLFLAFSGYFLILLIGHYFWAQLFKALLAQQACK